MARQYPPSPDEIRLWELASWDDNKIKDWDDASMKEYQEILERLYWEKQVSEVKKRRRVASRVTEVLQGTKAA